MCIFFIYLFIIIIIIFFFFFLQKGYNNFRCLCFVSLSGCGTCACSFTCRSLFVFYCGVPQRVTNVTPVLGSLNGGTRLTIQGQGFAQASQFNLNANDPNIGNAVTLVSSTRSVPCDVEKDSTHSTQITCYTRALPEDSYLVRVSVDGVPIPSNRICNGWAGYCMFYPRSYRTPSIQSIRPLSGPPGTVVTLRGRIYTDVYGSNTDKSSNGLNVRFLRAYMGGMSCELLKPNSDEKYGLYLDTVTSEWGYMSCKMTGTYVGHHNLSYILDAEYGRSLPNLGVFSVSALNKLSMFQTYAEVTGVSPSEGSVLGGTLLTIQGRYFDETDKPAMVLVGGRECQIQSVSNEKIICITPSYERTNMTVFPGGRGFKMEMWNNSTPYLLEDVLNYNSSRSGYSVQWIDSLSYVWPNEIDNFVARLSGFFVPTETDNYYFRIKADDRCQLYFSKTGFPKDKVRIAYQPYYTTSFFTYSSQMSQVMRLEKGKPYYIEILVQEYGIVASVDVAFFKEISPFTAQQTTDAVNEKQQINAYYDVLPEKQVVRFEGWTPVTPVNEVQTLRISSNCFSLSNCENTYYFLAYGGLKTGPIPVSASAMELQNALNDLWTIKPDSVTVKKQELDDEALYNVTFNSNRGNFENLEIFSMDSNTNITVSEDVKGQASLQTFTLLWGGVPSLPLPFNASETEVRSALDTMVTAKCPAEIPTTENTNVKFFRDYETGTTGFSGDLSRRGVQVNDSEAFCGRWSLKNPEILFDASDVTALGTTYGAVPLQTYKTLCLAYKGRLVNELGILFSYQGNTLRQENIRISVQFDSANEWNYKCVDLLSSIQANYIGTDYKLLRFSVYGESVNSVYFIDAVHLGREITALDPYVIIRRRRPPALASSGLFFSSIIVRKQAIASQVSYEITATPYYCGFGVPLFEIGFLKKMPNRTEDRLIQSQGNATVNITRPQKASPPLTGTFDVEFSGRRVEDQCFQCGWCEPFSEITKDRARRPLQTENYGRLSAWDCGFTWSQSKTPTVTGIYPMQGSSGLGTVLTITGSGFDGSNVTVKTGDVECSILQVTNTSITCQVGPASAGVQPVSLSFSSVGNAQYQNDSSFIFTHLLGGSEGEQRVTLTAAEMTAVSDGFFTYSNNLTAIITSVSPQTTTVFGLRILTILGTNFAEQANGSSVLIGEADCKLQQWTNENITCLLPALPPAEYNVRVRVGNQGYPLTSDGVKTTIEYVLEVTGFSPSLGSLYGGTTVTISGSGFSPVAADNNVTLGDRQCRVTAASDHYLECVTQSRDKTFTVTNQGFHPVYGQGYAWSPSALIASVGDTVVWRWDAPAFVSGLGYRVFSVSSPSSTNYDGIVFSSGNTPTAKGFFAYRFTSPGVYYYSSGYIDSANQKTLQGVVTVMPLEESTVELQVFVTGKQASMNIVSGQINSSNSTCVATSHCFRDQLELNETSDNQYFSFTSCATPTVKVGDCPCNVINSTSTEINCQLSPDSRAPVGIPLPVTVLVNNIGSAILTMPKEYDRRFVVLPVVDSVFPLVGSTTGNTRLFISGSGFSDGLITVAGIPCNVVSIDYSHVVCDTSPSEANRGGVVFYANSISSSCSFDCTFQYSGSIAPNVSTVLPNSVSGNATSVVITGSGFGSEFADLIVSAANILLDVTEVTNSSITVLVGTLPAGTHVLKVVVMSKGLATGYATLTSIAQASISPTSGSIAGGTPLLITGNGFVAGNTTVMLANSPCRILDVTPDTVRCITPPRTEGPVVVNIKVSDVVYPPQSPVGTEITVTGFGFGTDAALVSLEIDGVPCSVSSVTDTQLLCNVGEHAGGTFPVMFHHNVKGHALTRSVFTYELLLTGVTPNEVMLEEPLLPFKVLDLTQTAPKSSSVTDRTEAERACTVIVMNGGNAVNLTNSYTYKSSLTPVITNVTPRRGGTAGGTRLTITGSGFSSNVNEISVTIAGSVCDVQSTSETQIICDNASFFYIDVWSSPYTWGGLSPPEEGMFAVITAGQTILLDTSTPVLKMLLIQGGRLIFDEADIELQAENILITDGGALQIGTEQAPFQHKAIITLHGHLRSTELPVYGTKTLAVREGVLDLHGIPVPITWTRLSQTAQSGSKTLTLMDAVTWKTGDEIVIASTGHRHSQSENELMRIASVSADGRTLTLTEPLGYTHLGVSVTLPDGTVFEGRAEVGLLTRNIVVRGSNNGRFGEEVGSDQFGGCIMFHAPQPNQNLAIGRIEYSYVRGCGIHQSYNRAVTIHNTHNLLVERNVIYNIMGGAFFIEDGIETGNILQYNLAVFVKQSTSLLNDDVTPAAFWVTNPNNTIRHNAAAGGTHFGFWYRMHDRPDGPSYNPNICQKRVPLGQFFNNTVHSQGWFGLWIFQEYFPMRTGSCSASTPEPAVFRRLTSWNNEKGAEWVNVGAVQFSEFLMVNNEKAGVETKRIIQQHVSGWGLDGGAAVVNSTMVGHVDELGLGSNYCTARGVILPLDDGMSVINTKFVNFDRSSCAAIGVAEIVGTCMFRCGGWSARFSRIQYYQSPNKAWFRWEHEVALVVPRSNLLDPRRCFPGTEWSVGVPGAVCDNTINFHRMVVVNAAPPSLQSKDAILTNSYGTCVLPFLEKLVTHSMGWMAMVPTGQTYNWYFNGASQITNISYNGMVYGFRPENYIIINHNLTQAPDLFRIIDNRNGSTQPLNPTANVNGDWYFNQTSKDLYYMVSGRDRVNSRRKRNSVDRSVVDRSLDFKVYQCYYPNCIQPLPTPGPVVTTSNTSNSTRPANFILWSNESFWRSSSVNNFNVPQEGSDVIIPAGIWMVMDVVVPSLNKLKIVGVLEIPDTNNGTSTRSVSQYNNVVLNATYISIQGGRLIAGWPNEPFRGQLQIILRGSHSTPDWLLPSGPNQGSKVLGVFGSLDLYGMPHNVYHTKLARTSQAGTSNVSLQESVDWKVGDQILLSTTSYDPWETEIRTITAISDYGSTLTLDQPLSYTHIGNVALLTRNIKIVGQEYPEMNTESYGARVLVGTFFSGGITFRGKAQIRNVEFYHTGQEGWNDVSDPRYSLVFYDLGGVDGESYIKGCAFHNGFAPGIGVFETDGLRIRILGDRNVVRRNLVTMTLWTGSYNGRAEEFNLQWNAGIEVIEATNVILQGNIVAGYERVGYRINGETCPEYPNSVAQWSENEAHGGLYGLYMNKDGLPGCFQIQGFTIWRSFDFGIYVQVSMSVLISNVSLIDNGMGIMSLIYSPPSLSHLYSDKTVRVQGALIVGSSPNFTCSDSLSTTTTYVSLSRIHKAPRPPNGGRSGICWPTFESSHNTGPQKPLTGTMSYNAIAGLMTVSDTTFVGFKNVCSTERNFMFMTNPGNEDLQHPISVQRISKIDSTEDSLAFIHRPDLGLDADTETRRLSPVAILGDKYVDLINGPQDHGWCAGYTCQKRVSLFHAIVATNKSFDIFFSSTTPQKLRFMLLNAGPTEAVRVAVFYSNPQRLDVYVNNSLVGPTNAQWNADKTDYTLREPTYTGQYVPSFSSSHGSNFFDQDYKMLNILVRGSEPVEIRTSPVLFLAFNLPAMTEAEFFGPNLVNNLALFLKIPPGMIRITKIVREGTNARRRRSTGLTVEVEIREPPVQTSTNNGTENEQQFEVLKNIADDLGRAAVSGNLSQSIGFNVSSLGIIPPPPSSSDPTWNEVATQEVTREDQQVETVRTVSSLVVVVEPVAGSSPGPLSVQPSIMAVDTAGDCVSVGVTSLTMSAVLKDANGNQTEGLHGNTTIPFSGCWANYTNLAIFTSGENMKLAFTLNEWKAESRTFSLRAATTPSPVVVTTEDDDNPSIFDSSPAVLSQSVYLLMLLSGLLLLLMRP
ncbi:Fibrocystin-L [Labeo rohita]|uniref:Fibrocystin-L n=1 Tax=Labeo rohita TaxID=84645 RepID=A0ABQ8LQQ9_LABRO|nr:Fibrocystin-L [Labeo rohita]